MFHKLDYICELQWQSEAARQAWLLKAGGFCTDWSNLRTIRPIFELYRQWNHLHVCCPLKKIAFLTLPACRHRRTPVPVPFPPLPRSPTRGPGGFWLFPSRRRTRFRTRSDPGPRSGRGRRARTRGSSPRSPRGRSCAGRTNHAPGSRPGEALVKGVQREVEGKKNRPLMCKEIISTNN